ncbi:MAG: DUF502 domain-containing protein [Planctomycetaceae bacterium]
MSEESAAAVPPQTPELVVPKKPPRLTPMYFFLRGLAISLPTILTLAIVLWLASWINNNIISPATWTVKRVIAVFLDESISREGLVRLEGGPDLEGCGRRYLITKEELQNLSRFGKPTSEQVIASRGVYVPLGTRAVPYDHYMVVSRERLPIDMPTSSTELYMEYAAEKSFGSVFHLSAVAVVLVIVALYFLGRFVTARLGNWIVSRFESGVLGRVPVVRSVYGSVKQVTDFLFSEQEVEYRRVVAIEYPRRGIWSLGLVTGDSMLEIATAVGEPCLSVLIPSSPMPMTGYTMSIPRSEVLDLHISVEQAMQFCISCGVLVPPEQKVTAESLQRQLSKRFTENFMATTSNWKGPAPGGPGGSVGAPPVPPSVKPPGSNDGPSGTASNDGGASQ